MTRAGLFPGSTIGDGDAEQRLRAAFKRLDLSVFEGVACLYWAVDAYGGERGRQIVNEFRANPYGKHAFVWSEFADKLGVSHAELMELFELGVKHFGARLKAGERLPP